MTAKLPRSAGGFFILRVVQGQQLYRLRIAERFHIAQATVDGACAHGGLFNGFACLAQPLLRLIQQIAETSKLGLDRAQQLPHTSAERCPMASVRKPNCRLLSSADSVDGPAMSTR